MLRESGKPFHDCIDPTTGLVDRAIFSDQAIYELELERIFARAWNFMCHESQIPKPGDFFLSFIGEESVIATRDKKGQLQVLLNSCRHRGNAVCRAEEGNARSFLCTYHGWTYGLDGSLIGVPGYKDFYHEQLDKSQWGLVKAGKVASYKGFVFATMDPEAPDLEEYLGPVARFAIDSFCGRGTLKIVDGVQKNLIGCNWKLAVDNLFDYYHPAISHASANMSGMGRRANAGPMLTPVFDQRIQRAMLGAYGHAISGPRLTPEYWEAMEARVADVGGELSLTPEELVISQAWRLRPEVTADLGEEGRNSRGHPNIFPHMWLTNGGQVCLRMPRGPTTTELWWFTFAPEEYDEAQREGWIRSAEHIFGPAGLLEQDDGENWDQSTRQTMGVVQRRYPLHFGMNIGRGEPQAPADGSPTYIDGTVNEHAQLWTYRAWADWMDAESWASLRRDHTPAPTAAV